MRVRDALYVKDFFAFTYNGFFMEQIFFLIFAALAVASAIAVISVRNPVHSAVFLMVCFLQVAAIFVLLRSPFLAAVQVFVYVGAVIVLFLFVVMMLDIRKAIIERFVYGRGKFWAIVLAVVLLYEINKVLRRSSLVNQVISSERHLDGSVAEIGTVLFTDYVLPFEVISIVLLVALVGAVVLGRKEIR